MKIDKSIRSGNEKTDAYIAELENELTSFEASNIRKLIQSIDLLAGKIAKDIVAVSNNEVETVGEETNAKEVDTKLIDAFVKLVEKADKIKGFADTMKSMIPEVMNEVKVQENHKNGIDPSKNVFEQVQAMGKSKHGKNT